MIPPCQYYSYLNTQATTSSELADTLTAHVLTLIRLSFNGSPVMTSPQFHSWRSPPARITPRCFADRGCEQYLQITARRRIPQTSGIVAERRPSATLYAKLSSFVLTNRVFLWSNRQICVLCKCVLLYYSCKDTVHIQRSIFQRLVMYSAVEKY